MVMQVTFDEQTGKWSCPKCQSLYDNCNPKYILTALIADRCGATWASLFNEAGEFILERKASDIKRLRDVVRYT